MEEGAVEARADVTEEGEPIEAEEPPTKKAKATVSGKRKDRYEIAAAKLEAQKKQRAEILGAALDGKSATPCKWFELGKCQGAKLTRTATTFPGYLHECDPRPSPPPKPRKRKRHHKEFDSTLGYPGEGPATIVCWNANGLNALAKFSSMCRRANAIKADTVLLQEHNWGSRKQLRAGGRNTRTSGRLRPIPLPARPDPPDASPGPPEHKVQSDSLLLVPICPGMLASASAPALAGRSTSFTCIAASVAV